MPLHQNRSNYHRLRHLTRGSDKAGRRSWSLQHPRGNEGNKGHEGGSGQLSQPYQTPPPRSHGEFAQERRHLLEEHGKFLEIWLAAYNDEKQATKSPEISRYQRSAYIQPSLRRFDGTNCSAVATAVSVRLQVYPDCRKHTYCATRRILWKLYIG